MSEIVIENVTPVETVIEIEGGPTLTTVVAQESVTIVETPSDPVVIDLNSGARGEPGSAILTGPAYPTLNMGSIGDIYIVTEGQIAAGNVYTKTSLGWVESGNVRGPAGGIDVINGHTGPVVTLAPIDLGLERVNNTNDLEKPISTATQAALDNIGTIAVTKAGDQTITGVKTFTVAPIVPDSSWSISDTWGLQTALDARALSSDVTAALALKANDNAVVHLSGTETLTGTKLFSSIVYANAGVSTTNVNALGNVTVANPGGNSSIKVGRTDGVANTPFIDFHAGATASAYDVRLLVNSGTGTAGQGDFSIMAAAVGIYGNLTVNGTIAATGGMNASNLTGTIDNARLRAEVMRTDTAQTVTGNKTYTGTLVVPTPTIATHAVNKQYVDNIISTLTNGSPELLNTLDELAAALGDDPNFATTMANSLASKVSLTGDQTIAGVKTFSSAPVMPAGLLVTNPNVSGILAVSATGNAAVEIGNTDGVASTPFIDFHTSSTPVDYNVRILASGGTAVSGTGTLDITAAQVNIGGSFAVTGTITGSMAATNLTGTIADARLSSNVVRTDTGQTITGQKTFSGTIYMGGLFQVTSGVIELGRTDGTASTPSIDFHSGATTVDYDARISSTAGTGIAGGGTMSFFAAAGFNFNSSITASSFSGAGGSLTGLNANNLSAGTVAIARLPTTMVHRVVHNGTSYPARPTGATYVEWVGPTAPSAATANDTWVNTAL